MNYEEAVAYIHSIYWRGSKLGLVRVTELLELMGNPQDSLKFVHVAGTNGKGSTTTMISNILRASGYTVGSFISPYVTRFNERIQLNNREIEDDELAELTDYVRTFADAMPNSPTEFEVITAIAFEYYKRKNCDIVVVEVGLGGKLDSTNVIKTPEVAVITPIDFDHTHVLGNTLAEIASAKAGIIKKSGIVVTHPQHKEALDVLAETSSEQNAKLIIADTSPIKLNERSIDGQCFDYGDYKNLKIRLAGSYQLYNSAVALNAIFALRSRGWNIPDDAVYNGLANAKWPARFEVLSKDPIFIVDGGHNPHGVRGTLSSLMNYFPNEKITFILGVMADKDVSEIVSLLAPVAESFYTAAPNNDRAMPAEQLAELIKKFGVPATPCASVSDAVHAAISHVEKGGKICAVGSLYMAGEVRQCFDLE